MKSSTRTVLVDSLLNVTSYSSGPLDVGDLEFLLISAVEPPGGSGNTLTVSYVDANNNLIHIATLILGSGSTGLLCIGNGSTYELGGTNGGIPYFGDQIQIDISGTVTTQISVKGK
jgi:hypothetical protein